MTTVLTGASTSLDGYHLRYRVSPLSECAPIGRYGPIDGRS
jgi:hypothetical protein